MKKENVSLTLRIPDAKNVCSHLSETFCCGNAARENSRLRAVRKLQRLVERADKINKGEM